MKEIKDRVKIVRREQKKHHKSGQIIDEHCKWLRRICLSMVSKAWKIEFPKVKANIDASFICGCLTKDKWTYGVTIFEVNGVCATKQGWIKRGPPVDFPSPIIMRTLPTLDSLDKFCQRMQKEVGVPVRLWRADWLLKDLNSKEDKNAS